MGCRAESALPTKPHCILLSHTAPSYMTLHPILLNFLIYDGKFSFFISVGCLSKQKHCYYLKLFNCLLHCHFFADSTLNNICIDQFLEKIGSATWFITVAQSYLYVVVWRWRTSSNSLLGFYILDFLRTLLKGLMVMQCFRSGWFDPEKYV